MYEVNTLHLSKPFHNLDQQIEKLKNRGLEIPNEEDAKRQLLKTSYYDLINGYKDLFLEEKNDNGEEKYKEGTKFDDLTKLYKLDRELRHIVMKVSLDIESNFYTTLAYSIAEKYGEVQTDYLNPINYKQGTWQSRGGYERDNLFHRIRRRINDTNEHPMKHYKEKYNNIPPWILAKHLSFGELIVWYKLSPSDVKNNVIIRFTGVEPTEELKEMFIKSMELFNKFRNVAAHGGRIYNYKTNIEIPYRGNLHDVFYVKREDYNKGIGRSDFCAFLLARLALKQNDRGEYIEKAVYLNSALETYQNESPEYYNNVLKEMGLPNNYYERLLKSIRYEIQLDI